MRKEATTTSRAMVRKQTVHCMRAKLITVDKKHVLDIRQGPRLTLSVGDVLQELAAIVVVVIVVVSAAAVVVVIVVVV